MIRGYPQSPSLFAGETLVLHVSTTSPRFRVAFLRQGERLEEMKPASDAVFAGAHLPDGPPDRDWGWPAYRFEIPADWPSGVYVAALIEIGADGTEIVPDCATTFATSAKALFVLRHRGRGAVGDGALQSLLGHVRCV